MRMSLIACALLFVAGPVLAQNASREQEQLRRLRAQAQQLQQALSAEQQQRQAAAAELQSLKQTQGAELERLGEEAQSARRRAGSVQKQLDQAQRELEELRAAHSALTARHEQTSGRLAERERELGDTRNTLATTARELEQTQGHAGQLGSRLDQCSQDNVALYRTGIEMLDRWRDRTLGERTAQGEPFTQIGRVKLENLVETWRDRLDEKRSGASTSAAR